MKKNKLHNVKKTGFKTPDHYFESFEDKLFERMSESQSISDVQSTGFKVPKDYFDSVEDNVMRKLNEDETRVVKLSSRKRLYYIAGIAASLVLLFAIFIGKGGSTEELSVEMVETYLESQDLDSYELAQLLSDAEILEEDFTITQTNYNEENLESYLLDNVDIEAMLE
ncbi:MULTISPECIES: hypothetical protein [Winogradskyella]|uniref:Uncharacterized protein n=1 Tax=Winogradskyella ouciana TaxID=2608631 RepID=A0A7K1GDT4_9FLAO|nr:hypothetical protein [Winogradskyella ouciana]MTE27470.1 hypothetical protein [Winogradskyella ouciana]